jgi:hypothetical protein
MEEDEDLARAGMSDVDMFLKKKMLETLLAFNSHFTQYIKETNLELFNRAVDYAKTFTEEDVSGIILHYTDKEVEEDEDSSS